MRELALFAGAGGGILGGHLLGWRTVCAVEFEPYARDVLMARQNDGTISPPFPIWDDVRTFDGCPWRGRVDVVSGGFPCQDISAAGKGEGIGGERSGLWVSMARIVREVRPRFVFVENSPVLTSRGLGRVLGDLASLGFDAEWGVLGADDCGAPHRRKRIWIVAHARGEQSQARMGDEPTDQRPGGGGTACGRSPMADSHDCERNAGPRDERPRGRPEPGHRGGDVSDSDSRGRERVRVAQPGGEQGPRRPESDGRRDPRRVGRPRLDQWPAEPDVGRVAHGVAARVDRLRAIGNGQVPRVAATAFELLRERGGW